MLAEEGTYLGLLVEASSEEIGEKKTSALRLTFNITDQSDGAAWVPVEPSMRDVLMWLSDKAWERTQKQLAKMQFNGDFKNPQFDSAMSNPGIPLICTHDEYKGRIQENWTLASWNQEYERRPLSTDVARKLTARWDMGASASKKPRGKPGAPPSAPDPQEAEGPVIEDTTDFPGEDEIPGVDEIPG